MLKVQEASSILRVCLYCQSGLIYLVFFTSWVSYSSSETVSKEAKNLFLSKNVEHNPIHEYFSYFKYEVSKITIKNETFVCLKEC